jgi:hypothetical protein
MILLSIFAYAGGARPTIGAISSVTLEQPNPDAGQVMMEAAMGIFRATCEQKQPHMDRGKIFHFLICHLAPIRVMCDGF